MAQSPVVVVPGITATTLEDQYPIPPDEVWSALTPLATALGSTQMDRIALHPDDVRWEAIEPARVLPHSVFGFIYRDLVAALRHDLTKDRAKPTPVFAFPYDWRQDCARSADQLAGFVDEVLARTALLPHYRGGRTRVDLVGHSMGGMVIADYLVRHGGDKVRRVVTMGSPFEGAIDALIKLAMGLGSLTGEHPRDREREAARTIPAIYQLLPTFPGAIKKSATFSTDLFDVGAWQPSILSTLATWIKRHDALIKPKALFQQYLGTAKSLRDRSRTLVLDDVLPEGDDGWLAIVGVDAKTQVQAGIGQWNDAPSFEFDESPRNDWPKAATGDGTVPFGGACPKFIDLDRLVCVRPKDFDFTEFRDRAAAAAIGFHAFLPTVNLVQRLTLKFLRPEFDGDVWGWKAPGVAKARFPAWLTVAK